MLKRGMLALLSVFVLLLFSANSMAIGISPAIVNVEYAPGFEATIPYTVRSNSNSDIIAQFTVGGELSKYVTLSKTEASLKPGESTSFELTLSFPAEELDYAGPQRINVVAEEGIPEGSGVGSRTVVVADIAINFPYPGKYLEIYRYSVQNINAGENSTASWEVISKGEELVSFDAVLEIFDNDNNSVLKKDYERTTIAPGDIYKKDDVLTTDKLLSDKYVATLKVSYENLVRESNVNFYVGKEDVSLLEYKPKEFKFNEINKFTVVFENLWNGEFKNVNALIELGNVKSQTPSGTLTPFGTLGLEQFLDTTEMQPGTYEGNVTVFFGGNQKKFPITVRVMTEEESKGEVESEGGGLSLVALVIILLVLLVIINVFFILRHRKKENK